MSTAAAAPAYSYNVRLRGATPFLEADASKLGIRVASGRTLNGAKGTDGGTVVLSHGSNVSVTVDMLPGGDARVSATGLLFSETPTLREPYLSFCTTVDRERLRIDSDGVRCHGTFRADSFAGLESNFSSNASLDRPPSANALTNAYVTLSNMVRTSVASSAFALSNDIWHCSTPDEVPRLRFDSNGPTKIAAPTTIAFQSGPDAATTMVLGENADVAMFGDVWLGGSNGVRFSRFGCNLGINMPDGVDPQFELHVNGSVFSTTQFVMSDRRTKFDIRPLKEASDKLRYIAGYTYRLLDDPDDLQLGVIAQEVEHVLPEAVRRMSNGTLSVSYASLVAVAIHGLNELRGRIEHIERAMSLTDI